MSEPLLAAPVTAITAAILVPLYIWLALGVIKKRHLYKIAVGSGNHNDLETAIRAHGNFSEYVPFALLLILVGEINGSPVWLMAMVSALLVSGRWFHALAIPSGNIPLRVRAMKLTFAALALGAISNLVPILSFLLKS